MTALTEDIVFNEVKALLPIEANQTDVFDRKIGLLVGGAISKIKKEGVDIQAKDKDGNYVFTYEEENNDIKLSNDSKDYILCISYQVQKDLDYDSDMNFLTEQYMTRVGTIKCNLAKYR